MPRDKPELRTVVCEGCGVPFETTKSNKTFHNKECHTAHRARQREAQREQRAPLVKVCAFCDVEYTVGENGSTLRGAASSKYHSAECRDAANTKARTAKRRVSLGRAADEDGRATRKLSPHTVRQLDAVRAILNPDNPISVRSCCYHLLSLNLLESTENFEAMQAKITAARLRESDEPNFLDDKCFVDHSRVLEFKQGFASVEEFFGLVKDSYSRDPWQGQPLVPIV